MTLLYRMRVMGTGIMRYEDGKDYPIYCRKEETLDADEAIILDVNVLAEGHAYYSVGGLSISPDNSMLCFGVDKRHTLNVTVGHNI